MRSDIETYLGKVVDSTAKKIAANVGLDQLDVAKELNRMHADGVVEREKRNGNEYAYWLTRGEKVPPAAAENVPTAVAIVERSVDPETKAIEPADATEKPYKTSFSVAIEAPLLEALRAEIESLKEMNERLKANNADLEKRIDSLSGDVRLPGSMFVTMGRATKPMRHATIEKAQRRASALIRSERESEVLVLEPIGRMVRGSEWRDR
ncbi:1-pyrroline-5-carboxylate dehydrogenase [Burkholderia sp. AU19243]|uniref:1-pyrroline-5-carboxylate dehydrogenase n=1 Tax=Burkholderia sp. AU19243 TaxID=2824810 RepID=UPI001B93830B|nr:1-pyrroline-5-carboxylate dehydrogenase [Burkholderia sp. AU19243]MBR8362139.1 1-pyrroline-5-carboxylate dehydrogenase [Burkholderia sp. AU19243]